MKEVDRIFSLLEKRYGTPNFSSFSNPLDELILTILSQNTTWQNCRRAFGNLMAKFKNWQELMNAKERKIKNAIHPGGLANVKAERIKSILKQIHRSVGSLNLNFLFKMKDQEAYLYLRSFKGVGPKTANCVLLFSLKRPVLPVDTHILRVSKRLGLIKDRVNLISAHRLLSEIVPKKKVLSFHINVIQHGRKVCKPYRPKCLSCPILSFCRFCKKERKLLD